MTTILVHEREKLECFNKVRRKYKEDGGRAAAHTRQKREEEGSYTRRRQQKLMNKRLLNDIRSNVYLLLKS